MKRFLTLSFVFVFLAAGAMAAGPLRIGFRGGAAVSTYSMDRVVVGGTEIGSRPSSAGYQVGIAARLSIPGFIQIQPELVFHSFKYKYNVGNHHADIKTSRMELPVLVGFHISALRIFGGPVFRLSNSEKSSMRDFKVKYNDSTVAGQFGIGFDIKKFFFDVRYTTYFGRVKNSISYLSNTGAAKVRDDGFTFNMGFLF